MTATIPYIEQKFEEFNHQMFGGKLPKIPVENTRVDLPEREVEDTIIYEMIHYHIGYNWLEDASAHGPLFLSIMNEDRHGGQPIILLLL